MKRILTALVLGVSLLFASGGIGYSQDYQKGLEAYKKGDYETALREWSALAEQGDASAQNDLAMMYFMGDGVLKDDVYAHMWWNISASNGIANTHSFAEIMRDIVAKTMTTEQLAEAQKLARECVKKNYKGC